MAESTRKQISTTVSQEEYKNIQDYRFTNRIEKVGDVVAQAMREFLDRNNLSVEETEPKPGLADDVAEAKSER